MIREFTWAMNVQERKLLEERALWRSPVMSPDTLKWTGVWLVGLIACIALVAGALRLGEYFGPVLAAIPGVGVLVCLLALAVVLTNHPRWAKHQRDWKRNRLPKIPAALKGGTVNVRSVQATRVIHISPYDDEGDGYIFDVGDNKLPYTQGQWTYPVDETMLWPTAGFEMVRTAIGEESLGIFCNGQKLEPIRVIQSEDLRFPLMWEYRDELIDGELHAFADSLLDPERAPAKHSLD